MIKGRTTRNSISALWDDPVNAESSLIISGDVPASFARLAAAMNNEAVSPQPTRHGRNPQINITKKKTEDKLLVIEISDFCPTRDEITNRFPNEGDSDIVGQSPVKKISFCDLEILVPASLFKSKELLQDACPVSSEDDAHCLFSELGGEETPLIKPLPKGDFREFFVCGECNSIVPSKYQLTRHLHSHRNQPIENSAPVEDYSHLIRPCFVKVEKIDEAVLQDLITKKLPLLPSRNDNERVGIADAFEGSSHPGSCSTKSIKPECGTSDNCNGTSYGSRLEEVENSKCTDSECKRSHLIDSSDVESMSTLHKNGGDRCFSPSSDCQPIPSTSPSGGGFLRCCLCSFGASHINALRDHVLNNHLI